MARLRDDEIRRLLSYLHKQVSDLETFAALEEEILGDEAEAFLREPDLLVYFPRLSEQIIFAGEVWSVQITQHAHLRMVQRGIKTPAVLEIFTRFVAYFKTEGQAIVPDAYTIYDHATSISLRANIEVVSLAGGESRLVTVLLGRGDTTETIEVVLM